MQQVDEGVCGRSREGGSKLIGRRIQVGGDTWPPAGDGGGGGQTGAEVGRATWTPGPGATLEEIQNQKQDMTR